MARGAPEALVLRFRAGISAPAVQEELPPRLAAMHRTAAGLF